MSADAVRAVASGGAGAALLERIRAEQCVLVLVDIQERLLQAMPPQRQHSVIRAAQLLLSLAELLELSVLVTEQYPKGLLHTVAALDPQLAAVAAPRFEKTCFSACDAAAFAAALGALEVKTVLLLGLEAHVCVLQTCRDLLRLGYAVELVVDGVCSRRDDHREVGIQRCLALGAQPTTAESMLFELLADAQHPHFRALSRMIKDS